ncbi:rab-GTPase-TBC domain-containing protein [Blastocladiella britannica]|nr:rab-GTPase-TBC domain-containing protein [Blastocladiella britannica]
MAAAASRSAAHRHQAAAAQAMANLTLADEYADILASEVTVDVPRLRELARRYGVPHAYRGDVWRFLLGVVPADRSHELSTARARQAAYDALASAAAMSPLALDVAKRVRGDVSRYLRRAAPRLAVLQAALDSDAVAAATAAAAASAAAVTLTSPISPPANQSSSSPGSQTPSSNGGSGGGGMMAAAPGPTPAAAADAVRGVMERVLLTYAAAHAVHGAEYAPTWAAVVAPFAAAMHTERDAYFAFEAWMARLDDQFALRPLQYVTSDLMVRVRSVAPDVYNFLDEEEVDARDWLPAWLASALASAWPLDAVLRLWDVYIAGGVPQQQSGGSTSPTDSSPAANNEAAGGGLELHPWVCLAALLQLKEQMEDLEASEIVALLRRVPVQASDVDNLVNVANNLWLEQSHQARESAEYSNGNGNGGGNGSGAAYSEYGEQRRTPRTPRKVTAR